MYYTDAQCAGAGALIRRYRGAVGPLQRGATGRRHCAQILYPEQMQAPAAVPSRLVRSPGGRGGMRRPSGGGRGCGHVPPALARVCTALLFAGQCGCVCVWVGDYDCFTDLTGALFNKGMFVHCWCSLRFIRSAPQFSAMAHPEAKALPRRGLSSAGGTSGWGLGAARPGPHTTSDSCQTGTCGSP